MKKMMATLLLAGSSLFAAPRFAVGVAVGVPAGPPPRATAYVPPAPGPGYTWVAGSYETAGPRRVWRDGYWARENVRVVHVDPRIIERYDADRHDTDRHDTDRHEAARYDQGYRR